MSKYLIYLLDCTYGPICPKSGFNSNHQINCYPVGECIQNKWCYLLDHVLFGGLSVFYPLNNWGQECQMAQCIKVLFNLSPELLKFWQPLKQPLLSATNLNNFLLETVWNSDTNKKNCWNLLLNPRDNITFRKRWKLPTQDWKLLV